MNPAAAIRILIADDHPIVRQGLAALIGRQPGMTVVAEAGNGREAVDLFRLHQPDVTLVDLRMSKLDGVEAIALIRAEVPTARLILLTTFDGDEEIYQGLRVGAMAYLLKDAAPDELLEAIRAVHQGQKRISPEVAVKLANRMNSRALTTRERDVLQLVVAGQMNREIGESLNISEGTVRAHMNNILSKLEVSDRTQAATLAIKRGLVRLERDLDKPQKRVGVEQEPHGAYSSKSSNGLSKSSAILTNPLALPNLGLAPTALIGTILKDAPSLRIMTTSYPPAAAINFAS